MLALVVSPLLSLTFAVGVALPGIGLFYELRYRRERREALRASDSDVASAPSSLTTF